MRRLACVCLLVLACHKDDAKWHWKSPRTEVVENHGAKLRVPDGWRAQADMIYDVEHINLDDRDFAGLVSDDLHDVMALQWLPTARDLCAEMKVGSKLDDMLTLDRVEALPGGACKLTSSPGAAFIRIRGDHTLRFDCTDQHGLCEKAWASIALP
jgi:hypothetical protein